MSMGVQIAFGVSYMLFAFFSYYIRDWRQFYWVGGAIGLVYIPYIWLIDESPRWLLSVGRREEANKIITRVVEINGDSKFSDEMSTSRLSEAECSGRESWANQLKTLLKHKVLFYRLIVMASSWAILTVMYYGIAMTTNELEGDRFLNCFYSGLSEFASYFISYITVEVFGRRSPYILCNTLAALTIASAPFLGLINPALNTFTTIVAKFLCSISFYIVYVYTPELFPTQLRLTSTAFDAGFARIGGIILSFIIYSDKFIVSPIVGVLVLIQTALMLSIPKTHNVALPENIQEALALNHGVLFYRSKTVVENKLKMNNDLEPSEVEELVQRE